MENKCRFCRKSLIAKHGRKIHIECLKAYNKQKKAEYDVKNRERHKQFAKEYRMNNIEKIAEKGRQTEDRIKFGGKREFVFERDNWTCQECGMSQEQSILLFNRRLSVHHIDLQGVGCKIKNNDMDNLITICMRCHKILHMKISQKERFGDLLEQDDSEYRYPRIREVLDEKKKKLGTITKAKKEFAEEIGMSFWTMDSMYYERKVPIIKKVRR